jgi:phosphoribosyl 1,2-cyclic phosphodiesterase
MELIILGSGSTGNGYLLQSSAGEILIIETGIPLKKLKEAIGFDLSQIKGALISHSHKDHSGRTMEYLLSGIRCHASAETISEMKLQMGHNLIPVCDQQLYHIGGFRVMPFNLVHDVKCYGYLIKHDECGQIVFITDTLFSKYRFKDLNHMIIEANYSDEILEDRINNGKTIMKVRDRVISSHMSLAACKTFIKANDLRSLRNIILIHLSSGNSDAIGFIKEIREITGKNVFVARAGLKIDLNKQPF